MKKKAIAMLLMLTTALFMMSGCVSEDINMTVNSDGSGTAHIESGVQVSVIQDAMKDSDSDTSISSGGEDYTPEEIAEYPVKTIDGEDYYIMESDFSWENAEDFNQKASSEETDSILDELTLARNSDGTITLKFPEPGTDDDTDVTGEEEILDGDESIDIGDEELWDEVLDEDLLDDADLTEEETDASGDDDTYTDEELEEIMDNFVVLSYTVTFADAKGIVQTAGDDVSADISGNVLTIKSKDIEGITGVSFTAYYEGNTVPEESVYMHPEKADIFKDVTSDKWFAAPVNYMGLKGIVNGYGNGLFGPEDNVTVAQVCQIMAKQFEGTDLNGAVIQSGETGGYWAFDAIESMQNVGALPAEYLDKEITSENFDVEATREVAAAICAYVVSGGVEQTWFGNIPDIADADEANAGWIQTSYAIGLTKGMDAAGTFAPKKTLTRAELCQMLYNMKNA